MKATVSGLLQGSHGTGLRPGSQGSGLVPSAGGGAPIWVGEALGASSSATALSVNLGAFSAGQFAVVWCMYKTTGTWPAKTGWTLTTGTTVDNRAYGIYSKVLEAGDIGVVPFPGFSLQRVANAQVFSGATGWSNRNAGTSSYNVTWAAGNLAAAALAVPAAAIVFSIRTVRSSHSLHATLHQGFTPGTAISSGSDGNAACISVLGAHLDVADPSGGQTGPSFSAATLAQSSADMFWVT